MSKRYARKLIGPAIELIPMCPLCRGSIYWTMYGGREGQTAEAYCSNNVIATRIMIDPMNMITCKWEGYVVRNKNGAVDIFSSGGAAVPHKVLRHNKTVI
jgi:hypothetical protein